MATTPKLNVNLSGTNLVKPFSDNIVWTPVNQLEKIYYIKLSDGVKSIDFSDIAKIKLAVIKSDDDFTLTVTHNGSTINFELDYFVITPTTDFQENLTAISIRALSTTEQTIYVNIYGEEEETV